MKKIIIIIIAVILVAILLALGTYKILTKPVSKNIEEKKTEIPLGSGTSAIADILKENKLIRSKNAFKLPSRYILPKRKHDTKRNNRYATNRNNV